MSEGEQERRSSAGRLRRPLIAVVVVGGMLGATALAGAALVVSPKKISEDAFNNPTSQHHTEVEPDTFAFGNSVVATFQEGRFTNGGASDIGFATSTNGGHDWGKKGALPGLTAYSKPVGTAERASDPSVAYDSTHNVWLINSLLTRDCGGSLCQNTSIVVSRSTDGGLHWGGPVTVAPFIGSLAHDKNWIVCDNGATSPFKGRCYVAYSDLANGHMAMQTSTDGGMTWAPPVGPADNSGGIGVQPVVQPNGTVIVPFWNPSASSLAAVRSTDGGATLSAEAFGPAVTFHQPTAMRAPPVPSVEVDGAGRVYAAWHDCSFRAGCPNAANDLVMSTSDDGVTWTPKQRIPIDDVTSGVDHFIPGLAVDPAHAGATAHLAVAYYTFSDAGCTFSTCQLNTGFISSSNGGATWSSPERLNAKPMGLSWIADTTLGRMVGDYISTSFSKGLAVPVFALAEQVSGGGTDFHEAMYAVQRPVG